MPLLPHSSSSAPAHPLAAVVLAAGSGTRLRPLTEELPKPLVPVCNTPLLDHALARCTQHTTSLAVNLHAHPERMLAHCAELPVHLSHEEPRALGTAGALGKLRDWISERPALVVNADTYVFEEGDALAELLAGWDGERVRLLVTDVAAPSDFGTLRYAGAALMPWAEISPLQPVPSGLYEHSWARAEAEGRLELVETSATVIDCGTPREYLEANLLASGGESVVSPGARVEGKLTECVVWAGAYVRADEHLARVVRTPLRTVEAVFREKRTG